MSDSYLPRTASAVSRQTMAGAADNFGDRFLYMQLTGNIQALSFTHLLKGVLLADWLESERERPAPSD